MILKYEVKYPKDTRVVTVKEHFYYVNGFWYEVQSALNDVNPKKYVNELYQIEQSLQFNP